jgi:hypothetical protein
LGSVFHLNNGNKEKLKVARETEVSQQKGKICGRIARNQTTMGCLVNEMSNELWVEGRGRELENVENWRRSEDTG